MPTTSDQQSNETASRRFIVDEPGIDTELGIKGRGYSPDNGQTFIVQHTIDGTVYRLLDAQHLYPLLKPMFDKIYGPVEASLHWADILDKPDVSKFVTNNQLTSYYTKAEADSKLSGKADASALSAYAKSVELGSVRSTAEAASSTASSAQETARKAQNTAESAESRAESAYSLASTASSDVQATTQVPIITSGTLADLANNQGSYHYEIDFIPSDSPTYDWGLLDVVVGTNYAKQVFTNTNDADVYVRTRIYGSWSSWRQVTLWS